MMLATLAVFALCVVSCISHGEAALFTPGSGGLHGSRTLVGAVENTRDPIMAAPRKKRAVVEAENEPMEDDGADGESEDMSDDDVSSGEDDEMIDQVVQVDFEAREAEDADFHGIKKLLQQLFLKANINTSELANTIISQNYVGSVLKQMSDDDEEDENGIDRDDDVMEVFGVMSVINLTERKDTEFVNQLKTMLFDRCKQYAPTKAGQLQSRLADSSKQLGFLVSERFINIPPQMAAPSYDSLRNEMQSAAKRKMKYAFDDLLMISKIYKPKQEQGKKKKGPMNVTETFINQEEELFFQESSLSFDYSVADEHDSVGEDENELLPWRRVMIVPASKFDVIIERTKLAFSQ